MSISLFYPTCPHADPTVPGSDRRNLNTTVCGRCISVPRYWQLMTTTVAPGATADTVAMFAQRFVLSRELGDFEKNPSQAVCEWLCTNIPGLFGSPFAYWRLYYGSIQPPGGGLTYSGWILTAIANPNDPLLMQLAAYACPDVSIAPWNCLGPNTLQYLADDSYGFTGRPTSVVLQPYYP